MGSLCHGAEWETNNLLLFPSSLQSSSGEIRFIAMLQWETSFFADIHAT